MVNKKRNDPFTEIKYPLAETCCALLRLRLPVNNKKNRRTLQRASGNKFHDF